MAAAPPKAHAADRVFYAASDFTITEAELQQYLGAEISPSGDIEWGSPMKVQGALSELYVLKVLSRTAFQEGVMSDAEKAWIAYFQPALEATRRLTAARVAEQMESVDWSQEAQEYYVANKSEFLMKDAISVRTLLIRTENRSALEALTLADELTSRDMTVEQFEDVVLEYT
jgi:hypothetical protein